jgi:hypothetical protein
LFSLALRRSKNKEIRVRHEIRGRHWIDRADIFRASVNLRRNPYMCSLSADFRTRRLQHADILRCLFYPVHRFLHSRVDEKPLDLLMRWRHQESTNSRDRVYALLGLLSRDVLPSAQACSYDVSPASLFGQVTHDLIREEGGLRPFIGSTERPLVTQGMPT